MEILLYFVRCTVNGGTINGGSSVHGKWRHVSGGSAVLDEILLIT
jgi:hypothetical protein